MPKAGDQGCSKQNSTKTILSGFALLLILSWLPHISTTISLAPDGYSCCPIVTVEVDVTSLNALVLYVEHWVANVSVVGTHFCTISFAPDGYSCCPNVIDCDMDIANIFGLDVAAVSIDVVYAHPFSRNISNGLCCFCCCSFLILAILTLQVSLW